MPASIKIFLTLNYVAIAIGSVATIVDFLRMPPLAESAATFVIALTVLSILVALLLVTLAGFGRQNWARWLYLAILLIDLAIFVAVTVWYVTHRGADIKTVLGSLQAVMEASSLFFVFSTSASSWFRKS